jgi:hypothetical protein
MEPLMRKIREALSKLVTNVVNECNGDLTPIDSKARQTPSVVTDFRSGRGPLREADYRKRHPPGLAVLCSRGLQPLCALSCQCGPVTC